MSFGGRPKPIFRGWEMCVCVLHLCFVLFVVVVFLWGNEYGEHAMRSMLRMET